MPRPRLLALAALLAAPACFVDGAPGDAELTSATSTGDPPRDPTSTGEDSDATATDAAGRCGDAIVDPGESCDYGVYNNGMGGSLCRQDCTLNVCGDGYLASTEACDDGNTIDDDACSNTCLLDLCGDGELQAPEQCDDGNQIAGDACTDACMLATCGDGIVQTDVEACDDGNTIDGDACDAACQPRVCGDGELHASEACDDGNSVAGDGCSPTCERDALLVFATSERYDGALDGLAGADQKCGELAAAAGLTGSYLAWLSDAEQGPAQRFAHSELPHVLRDGTLVASGWTDLTDGALAAPINLDEHGEPASVGEACDPENAAWTNTNLGGQPIGNEGHCFNWSINFASGVAGQLTALGAQWTKGCPISCESKLHLYCFEQP